MARELTEQAKTDRGEEGAASLPDQAQPAPLQTEPTPQDRPPDLAAGDIDPATVNTDEEDEGRLPEVTVERNVPLTAARAYVEDVDVYPSILVLRRTARLTAAPSIRT